MRYGLAPSATLLAAFLCLAAPQHSAGQAVHFYTDTELVLFGGPEHDVFLGCLSCQESDPDSVFNPSGEYGAEWSRTSIHTRWGEFGSLYGDLSACSAHATDPPVIVDRAGNFYGRLTLNRAHREAIRNSSELIGWLEDACR